MNLHFLFQDPGVILLGDKLGESSKTDPEGDEDESDEDSGDEAGLFTNTSYLFI